MRKFLVTLAAGAALSAQAPAPKKAATASAKKPAVAAPAAPNRALLNPSALKAKAPDVFKAKFTTTKGDFVVEVHRDWAPLGADRFYNLVKNGFFDNAGFFRVVPGFVVQFGLNGSPAVNRVWETAKIKDDPVKESNKKGYLVFATAGPNTRTTQLFINLADNGRLDSMGFAPFGTVSEGMDVVEKIYSGYGEMPDQGRITSEGKAYLDKSFPLMDSTKMARIAGPASPAPAAKKPASPAKSTTPVRTPVKPAAK